MLTKNEKKYLKKIPANKKAKIQPYNPKTKFITQDIKKELQKAGVNLKILWMGASALGIAGQNDIDLYIICPKKNQLKYIPLIEKQFGKKIPNITIHKWEFKIQKIEVEMYLADPFEKSMQEQIKIFKILKNSPKLKNEYEKLKQKLHNQSFRKYMQEKYKFFHKILKQ